MKKIKYILLIFLIGIVTGCSAEYNLKIDKDYINENIRILNSDKSTWDVPNILFLNMTYKEYIDYTSSINEPVYFSTDLPSYKDKINGIDYYDISIINTSNTYGLDYKFKHEIDKYKDSRILKICYDKIDFDVKDKNIKITTSNKFNCFENYEMLDEVVVNVTTSGNYEVISSNADKQNNGKYTWIINKDNASNKPIEIELKKVINWKLILFITIPSIIVIVIVYFILKRKIAKNNQL